MGRGASIRSFEVTGRDRRRSRSRTALVWWVRAVMLLAVVGLLVAASARTSSPATSIEVGAAFTTLLGFVVSFGGLRSRPGHRSTEVAGGAGSQLAAATATTLAGLDHIEHRRLDLGRRWLQAVVGPTGVVLVDVCPGHGADAHGRPGRGAVGGAHRCAGPERLGRAVEAIRGALGQDPGLVSLVPVRAVLVAPVDTEVAAVDDVAATGHLGTSLLVVPVDRLADVVSRGPVLCMDTVERTFGALTRAPVLSDAR